MNYLKFEDKFQFHDSSNQAVIHSYSAIKRRSVRKNINRIIFESWFCQIGVRNSQPVTSYFTDQFVEMVLGCPLKTQKSRYVTYYEAELFKRIKRGFEAFPSDFPSGIFTPTRFLRRLTHDGLVGYRFDLDPTSDDGRFISQILLTNSASLGHFFMFFTCRIQKPLMEPTTQFSPLGQIIILQPPQQSTSESTRIT